MGLLKRWLLTLWNKLFPIKKYINGIHYTTDCEHIFNYILVIKILKGPYTDGQVGFETIMNEGFDDLAVRTRLIKPSYSGSDFTLDSKWCIIAADIFQDEFEAALKNYRNIREEVITDEDDRTDYFEESATQRTVYKKGNSLSKKRVLSRQKRKTTLSGNAGLHSKVQPPADHGSDTDIFGSER